MKLASAQGPDETVYEATNKVRARVEMPPTSAGMDQAGMREAIRHERRVELAFEEHRFWDVRRWGIAEQLLNRPITGMRIGADGEFSGTSADGLPLGRFEVEQRSYLPKMRLMPIP